MPWIPPKEFYAKAHKIPSAAGILYLDEEGSRVFLLKSGNSEHWEIPGGMSEPGESPRETCLRECKEELGIIPTIYQLLCIDYDLSGASDDYIDEKFMFIFYGGKLSEAQCDTFVLSNEHTAWSFFTFLELESFCNQRLAKRLQMCLGALTTNQCLYLENSELKTNNLIEEQTTGQLPSMENQIPDPTKPF